MAMLALMGILAGLSSCGDFEVTCHTVTPTVLPDGSPPGPPNMDRSWGPEMPVWGTERNAVRESVGALGPMIGGFSSTSGLEVRGLPARLQAAAGSFHEQPAIVWREHLCEYTIWLDASLTDAEIIDYAGRF